MNARKQKTYRRFFGMIFVEALEPVLVADSQAFTKEKSSKM